MPWSQGPTDTAWPHFTPGKDPVPIIQEVVWAPGPVWKGRKSSPIGIRSWTIQPLAQSLYRLSYPTIIRSYWMSLWKRGDTVNRKGKH